MANDTVESQSPAKSPPALRPGWRPADIARAATICLAVWFGLRLAWSVSSLIFLVFLATLFGLAISTGVDFLERYRIRRGVGSALITLTALASLGGALAWTAPTLITQSKELQQEFPTAIRKVQSWLDSRQGGFLGSLIVSSAGGNQADTSVTEAGQPGMSGSTVRTTPTEALRQRLSDGVAGVSHYLFSIVSNTVAALTAFVLMVFLAMYIAAEPVVYRTWLLAVVPATSRPYVREVLARVAVVLRKWLLTQLIAMIVIGLVSMVALLILDVKAAFALAFIAGLMEFIPTVGPILSAVPAVLMGFVDSPEKALAVAIVYWGIQFLENNLLIPYLMRGEMDLPPAITLVAQALMTLTFGFLGLMVAVPLTAAVLVPVRMVAEREDARELEHLSATRRLGFKRRQKQS